MFNFDSIGDMFGGFAKMAMWLLAGVFLLKFFGGFSFGGSGSEDAPEVSPNKPSTKGTVARIEPREHEIWRQYREANAGRTVVFGSPIGGDVPAVVTSGMGMRKHPRTGKDTYHRGVDIDVVDDSKSTNIVAAAEGVVLLSDSDSGYGKRVLIGHLNGSATLYAHMTGEQMPAVGSLVKKGSVIGIMGNSGLVAKNRTSDGIHLHYEQWDSEKRLVQPQLGDNILTKNMRVPAIGKPTPSTSAQVENLPDMQRLPVAEHAVSAPPLAFAGATVSTVIGRG